MRWLGLDTATARLSVAVGTDEHVMAAVDVDAPRDHMARLAPLIQWVLDEAGGLTARELDAVAVGVGPGSYTGARIGVATAKGIAKAAGLPLFGVPTLDAVAEALSPFTGVIVVIADAARGEVYPMVYRVDGTGLRRAPFFEVYKASAAAARLAEELKHEANSVLLAGDGLTKHGRVFFEALPLARVAPREDWYPKAHALIRRATVLASKQEAGEPDLVLPVYTRLSDAEEAAARTGALSDGPRRGPKGGRP